MVITPKWMIHLPLFGMITLREPQGTTQKNGNFLIQIGILRKWKILLFFVLFCTSGNVVVQASSLISQNLQQKDSTGSGKKEILTDKAPKPVAGVYSQAVRVGNTLYLAGQIGQTTDGKLAEGGTVPQLVQAFTNIQAVLVAAGYSLNDVVKVSVFLKNMNDFTAMNNAYSTIFKNAGVRIVPVRTTVEVARLPRDAAVEVEVIAAQ